jgi:KaiC/GvpD/RAD55 family RecA-like ATPase
MQTQAFGTVLLGKEVQQQIILHMARDYKVLQYARQQLALADFDWEICQVVAKALYDYYDTYNRLPTIDILAYEIQQVVLGARGDVIPLHDSEYEYLARLLQAVRTTPDSMVNPEWALRAIGEYIMQVRVKRFNMEAEQALRTGIGIEDIARRGADLAVDSSPAAQVEFSDAFDISNLPVYNSDVKHISTGLTRMDAAMLGGPMPGELGLLAACQGIGKTNAMINFLISAVKTGWYGLFLSLEMPVVQIQKRTQAIASHIMAKRFREGALESFTNAELQRLQLVNQRMANGRLKYADLSAHNVTFNTLDTTVNRWLEWLEKIGKRHLAGLICIDYMDLISHGRAVGSGKSDLDPDVMKKLMDTLKKQLVNRTKVATIIATQATRAAEGQQIFHRRHVAWSFHKIDAIDYGFGIAAKDDTRLSQLDAGDDDLGAAEQSGVTVTGRNLSFSFFKMRDGNTGAFSAYQAPTLRLYNTQKEYTAQTNIINGGEYAQLFAGYKA